MFFKKSIVSRSSADAEYRSMRSTLSEIVWLNNLLNKLCCKQQEVVVLHCDNNVAIQVANNPVFHERTKHIEINCHYIREKVLDNVVQCRYVKTK